MAEIIEDLLVLESAARRDLSFIEDLQNRIAKSRHSVSKRDQPDPAKGVQITVSVEWITWMINFFEGDPAPAYTDSKERPI